MLLKPNSSKNTKHNGNTKEKKKNKNKNKMKQTREKEQNDEKTPILYLMYSKLYSIYIVMYYPHRRAN